MSKNTHDVTLVNLSHVNDVKVLQEAPTQTPPELADLDLTKVRIEISHNSWLEISLFSCNKVKIHSFYGKSQLDKTISNCSELTYSSSLCRRDI